MKVTLTREELWTLVELFRFASNTVTMDIHRKASLALDFMDNPPLFGSARKSK